MNKLKIKWINSTWQQLYLRILLLILSLILIIYVACTGDVMQHKESNFNKRFIITLKNISEWNKIMEAN